MAALTIPSDRAELPQLPRRHTLSFYLALFGLIAPLWSTLPASWLFVVFALRSGKIWSFAWPGRILFMVALCEVRHHS